MIESQEVINKYISGELLSEARERMKEDAIKAAEAMAQLSVPVEDGEEDALGVLFTSKLLHTVFKKKLSPLSQLELKTKVPKAVTTMFEILLSRCVPA